MNKHLDSVINKMRIANMALNEVFSDEALREAVSLDEELQISAIQDLLGELMDSLRDLYEEEK